MVLRALHARPVRQLSWPAPAPKAHVEYELFCWECRQKFIGKRVNTMYCGHRCKMRAYRTRRAAKVS